MPTRNINRPEWLSFLNEFSRLHAGERGSLYEIGPETGDMTHVKPRAFVGISCDPKGSEAGSITVILGAETGDNIEQVIARPTALRVREGDAAGHTADVEIEQEDGPRLILELTSTPALSGAG